MHQVLRPFVAALAIVALAYVGGMVSAQAPVKQIKLSEKHIESFIAAHGEMMGAFEKMTADTSEEEEEQQLDAIARKFGFKSYTEYEDVVGSVDIVMFGLDPETKTFTDPPSLVKKDIEDAKADKTLSDEERQEVVEELTEELEMTRPIKHPGNIELVKKYYDKLEALLQ